MKQYFTVRQGALDGVEAFLSVAQHRSFRKAAAELGVTPSAISQAVRALEERLGAPLFIRTTRSVGLTEAGERFLSRAKPAFEELVAASEAARDLGQRPAGLLRLAAPPAVVPILLEPLLASFAEAYPEVEVEIAAGDGWSTSRPKGSMPASGWASSSPPTWSRSGLRRRFRSSSSAARNICAGAGGRNASTIWASMLVCAFAARTGRSRHGHFSTATISRRDRFGAAHRARLSHPPRRGRARVSGWRRSPRQLPRGRRQTGKLVRVLKPFAPMAPGVFLFYPSRHQMMPKLRAFIDHVKSRSRTQDESPQTRI